MQRKPLLLGPQAGRLHALDAVDPKFDIA